MEPQVFQETHTSGHLWWKRTWYTYTKYFEGGMHWIPTYSQTTIRATEKI